MLKNTTQSYGWLARLLHWLLAVLVIGLLTVGLTMGQFEMPLRAQLYGLHKATGICVLALVTFRLIWRLSNPQPVMPAHIPALQRLAAHAVHIFLYIAMIIMPLSGWAMSSAGGHAVSFYGLFTLPPLVGKSKALGGFFNEVHEYLALALIAAIIVHIGAALMHHFVHKDNILRRMLRGS